MKHNQSIAFIVTFSAESYREYFYSSSQKYRIHHCVYINKSINANNRDEKAEVIHLLNELIEYLPKPYNDGINAFHRLSWLKNQHQKLRHQGESFYGGYTIYSKSIKFSLRGLQERLANRIKSEDFLKVHENYFLNQILSGKTIQDIMVYRYIDKDDDWVEIEYTAADKNILFSLTDNLIQVDGDSLKMPLVSLQIILANLENIHNNQTSYNHFLDKLFKYFENKLIEGRLIQKIFILNGFQDNTDWVEIEFGEKDAAISKFSFPKSI